MAYVVDPFIDSYGLNGGTVISGSVTTSVEGYVYYPLVDCAATLNLSLTSGSALSATYSAGIPVYGLITEVTQSSGVAIVYKGREQSRG